MLTNLSIMLYLTLIPNFVSALILIIFVVNFTDVSDNSILLMGGKFIPSNPFGRPTVPSKRTLVPTFDVEAFISDKFKPRTVITPKWATSEIKLHSTHIAAIVFLSFLDLIKFELNGKNYRVIFKVPQNHAHIELILKALIHLQPISYNRPVVKDGFVYFRTMTLLCLTEFYNKYLINNTINFEVLDLLNRNYLLTAGKFKVNYYQLPIQSSLFDDKQMDIICDKFTALFQIKVTFDPSTKILRTCGQPDWVKD